MAERVIGPYIRIVALDSGNVPSSLSPSATGPGGMAADYPTRFPVGEPQSLTIGIGNHEYRNVTYTVETILVNMIFDPSTNTSTLKSLQPLDSFTVTLAHNETREFPYTFTVHDQQYNQLQFLLFNETVPVQGPVRTGPDQRQLPGPAPVDLGTAEGRYPLTGFM